MKVKTAYICRECGYKSPKWMGKCPSCGAVINLDEEMLEAGAIDCPDCGEELEFDIDDEEDEISF